MKGCKLKFEGICKSFPGVRALHNVGFEVYPGEVLALMGENGAGKSTLLKVLNGDYLPESGTIYFDDQPTSIQNPQEALKLGISILYQERHIVPELSVAENIFVGKLPMNGPFVKWDVLYKNTQKLLDEFDMSFSPKTLVKDLSLAHQQMVEIMKEYNRNIRIMAFDEPTASLSEKEIKTLFKIISKLKVQGVTILYVSHRMKEVFDITDRIAVLKDGEYVGTVKTSETEECDLIKMMVGREICEVFKRIPSFTEETVLEAKGLTNQKIKDISFKLRKGEVLGFSGLVGAGRSEVARAIFGADLLESGELFIDGKKVKITNPKVAIGNGIALCPEDRKYEGLVMLRSVKDNTCVAILKDLCSLKVFVNSSKEKDLAQEYVEKLRTKTPSIEQLVKNLSGGNQQKVVVSKWLATKPKILILDEPTRGIDVGAKSEIYDLINALTAQGISVIFISSELPEVLGMSDRILVMKDGKITGELSQEDATEEKIIKLAMISKAEGGIAV